MDGSRLRAWQRRGSHLGPVCGAREGGVGRFRRCSAGPALLCLRALGGLAQLVRTRAAPASPPLVVNRPALSTPLPGGASMNPKPWMTALSLVLPVGALAASPLAP